VPYESLSSVVQVMHVKMRQSCGTRQWQRSFENWVLIVDALEHIHIWATLSPNEYEIVQQSLLQVA